MRVLIVDDDAHSRQILQIVLGRLGLSVTLAADGAEAVALARETLPELIVMDILMPVLDGLEAARLLRAEAAFRTIPMLAVTALAFESDRLCALEAGFDAVVTKPFCRSRLLGALDALVPGLSEGGRKVPA